jgi:hypothetical protein
MATQRRPPLTDDVPRLFASTACAAGHVEHAHRFPFSRRRCVHTHLFGFHFNCKKNINKNPTRRVCDFILKLHGYRFRREADEKVAQRDLRIEYHNSTYYIIVSGRQPSLRTSELRLTF